MTRPARHSYSSISTWEECPAKYYYSYIKDLPWPSSAAMERGTMLHKKAEDFMNDPSMPIPYDLRRVGPILDSARAQGGKAEVIWLVNEKWEPTEDQSKAKMKAIVDLHWVENHVLHVRDHKSGREYPSHRGQLELYSILGLLQYPLATRAESAAIYLDGGYQGQDGSIIRAMLPSLIDKWGTKVAAIEGDNDFVANPGSACRWCPYRESVGGPCGESAKAGQ
jgi:PD-(D/E)XK nuclease superfamily